MVTGERVEDATEHATEPVTEHAPGAYLARTGEQAELVHGEVRMPAGRISAAREIKPLPPTVPFSPAQLARLDEALTLSSRSTGLDFSVYLGELGEDSRAQAEALHASIGENATHAVLISLSPGQRVLEIVTGEEAHRRLSDRACKLAVMGMVASFKEGDLIGGLVSGLRNLTDQAGSAPRT